MDCGRLLRTGVSPADRVDRTLDKAHALSVIHRLAHTLAPLAHKLHTNGHRSFRQEQRDGPLLLKREPMLKRR